MRKFLSGVLIGILVTILGLVLVVLIAVRLFTNRQPSVPGNSVLVLSLEGDVPEANAVDFSLPIVEGREMPTVRDVWASLHQAASDSRIKGLVLQPRNLSLGWGRLQELREEITDFKRSGKPVFAFLQGAGSREYYLASSADKIYLSPDDMLDVKGFRVESTYLKGTLDKLGVTVQVDHIGRFKDAGDMFTRTDMSAETREVLNQVLDQLFNDFCATVAAGRHKTRDDIQNLIDQGPFMAQQAKKGGLADELGYEDQVYADLKRKSGSGDLKKISIASYAKSVTPKGDKIAYIVGQGDIIRGSQNSSFNSDQVMTAAEMAKLIRQVRNDSSMRGAVIRVNSPGGDAVASDEILHELKLLSAVKPVIISMSDLAASGGYFISMTGDSVVSYPNTITGSIGVLYVRPNLHDLYGKLGIEEDLLTRGKMADIDSLYQPLSDPEKQKLHESIQTTYNSFVSKVASARRKTFDQVDALAQGRVWMGAQARQNGLVDELGGLDLAISLVRNKAKLSPQGETNLVPFPPKRSWLEILTSSPNENLAEAVTAIKLRKMLPNLPGTTLLQGGTLRIMPYRFTVQ